ncbi:MAG: arginine--tRNA ligase [Pseudomonadota bacterium]|nr:arginine--tRNA ligase [Pseudomonadota bacterium]
MNIFEEFKEEILSHVSKFLVRENILGKVPLEKITVEPPRDRSFGELSTNAALIVAQTIKIEPQKTAKELCSIIERDARVESVDIAGPGFINLQLKQDVWNRTLKQAYLKGYDFGRSRLGRGKKINVEYVSANPTGPLHVGHTRGAVFGDALSNLLEFSGFQVTREYYVNDAGSQIDTLSRSVFLRYCELYGQTVEFGENSYPGEYLIEVAKSLSKKYSDQLLPLEEEDWLPLIRQFSTEAMLSLIKADLKTIGIRMDEYYSEKKLCDAGKIDKAIDALEQKGLIYEGKLPAPKGKVTEDWEPRDQLLFKATEFGDDVDRPMKKSDGDWTYFAPDVAYHYDKIERKFDKLINVFGADHSGYVKRMKAAVAALSNSEIDLDIKLCQLVRLFKDGKPYKMSKREGNFVTLRDLVAEVGKDVVRFLMLTRRNDVPLDFDFDKALEQSKDNAVFYVQYAHARCCSIIKKADQKDIESNNLEIDSIDLSVLTSNSERRIILKLCEWPRVVEQAAHSQEPHRIVFFLYDLASDIHSYQHEGKLNEELRVLASDLTLMRARLVLIKVCRQIICSGLNILGVTPLTKM